MHSYAGFSISDGSSVAISDTVQTSGIDPSHPPHPHTSLIARTKNIIPSTTTHGEGVRVHHALLISTGNRTRFNRKHGLAVRGLNY